MPLPPPEFGLSFLDGRGRLSLRSPVRVGPLSVERLEVELPGLRSPLELAAGSARVQNRRGELRSAALSIDEEDIAAWMEARRAAFAACGIGEVTVRVGRDALHVAFTSRVGDHVVDGTARISVAPRGRRSIALAVDEVRMYGYSPVAAPLWGLALLQCALGADAPPTVIGLGEISIDPLDLTLWRSLPRAGYRLPAHGAARLAAVRTREGRVEIEYRADEEAGEVAPATVGRPCPAGDELLAANCLDEALTEYRSAAAAAPHPELGARALSILVASPSRWTEAAEVARAELERAGTATDAAATEARLVLAAIDAEAHQPKAAAARYTELAFAAQRAGEREDERAALRRAAALFALCDPERATPALERLLSLPPSGPETPASRAALAAAAERLAERYFEEDRLDDLERLERRRLDLAFGPDDKARVHVRLAALWLDRRHDRPRAFEELERAIHLAPRSLEAWELAVRLHESIADRPRALAALDRLIEIRAADPAPGAASAAAASHLRAAGLLDGVGDTEAALSRFELAALLDPSLAVAHVGAARLQGRLGRHADADASFERALGLLPDGAGNEAPRRAVLLEWSAVARARRDLDGARRLLLRAAALGEDREVLAALVEQALADGQLDEAQHLLTRLSDLGDRGAPLRRAGLLLTLDRAAEARAIALGARSHDAAAADRIVADACSALGDGAGRREALDRLLAIAETPALRLELCRVALDADDLAAAERYLSGAGAAAEVLVARAEILSRRHADAALADVLGQLAALRLEEGVAHDPSAAARALMDQGAARLRLDQRELAAESFRRALRIAESDEARAGLAEAAWRLRRWEEARSAAEPLYQRGIEPRAQIALRLGVIADRRADAEAAREFYRSALEAGAAGADAVRAYDGLIAILTARGDGDEAVQTLLAAADDPRSDETQTARAGRLVGAANLLRRKGRPAEATPLYERALGLDPSHLGALDALEALAAGDPERVASILERKVAATRSRPMDQKAILGRLGMLLADRLARPNEARAAHRRVLTLDPDYRPSLRWLAAAARSAGDRGEEALHLARLAKLPADPAAADGDVDLHARLALLLADAGDDAGAEEAARRALALAPHQPAALEILDGILTRAERLEELEPLLSRRLEAESGFDRSLHFAWRRAALLERLGRREEAARAYDQILRLRPTSARAWERLAALYRETGAWPELVTAQERLAARRATDGEGREAATLLVEAARTALDQLGDRGRAGGLLRKALGIDPRGAAAIDALLALARSGGDQADEESLLARRIETEDDGVRRDALVSELARLRRERGGARAALDGLRATSLESAGDASLRLRAELAIEVGAWPEAASALSEVARRARREADVEGERVAVRELARITRSELGNERTAEALYRRALELDPADAAAAETLVELARARDDLPSLRAALELQLEAIRRGFEGPVREAELCVEIARTLRAAGDPAGAEIRLHESLEADPRHAPALVLLGDLHLERGETTAALQALELAVETAPDPSTYALLIVALEASGESARAAAALEHAGDAVDPAWRAGVLERAGREEEALDVWRALGGEAGARGAAAILYARAAALDAEGQTSEAAFWARQALHEGPCEPSALRLAARDLDADALWVLAERTALGRAPEEASATWRVAAGLAAGPARTEALRRAVSFSPTVDDLIALADAAGGDEGRSRAREAVAAAPGSIDAALALARHAEGGDALGAIEHLEALEDGAPVEVQPSLLLALGRLRLERGEREEARSALERALSAGARGEVLFEALRALVGIAAAVGDQLAVERHLERLDLAGAASADELRMLADVHTGRGDHGGAVALLRRAGAPMDTVLAALDAAADFPELVDALAEAAERSPPAEGVAMLRRASAIADGKLGDPTRAALLLERAADLAPDADVWMELGRLHAERLGGTDFAALCFARARAADRGRADVPMVLGELHFRRGELDPAEDYLSEALAHGIADPATRALAEARLAEIAASRSAPLVRPASVAEKGEEISPSAFDGDAAAPAQPRQYEPIEGVAALGERADERPPLPAAALLIPDAPRVSEATVRSSSDVAAVASGAGRVGETEGMFAAKSEALGAAGERRARVADGAIAPGAPRATATDAATGVADGAAEVAELHGAATDAPPAFGGGPPGVPELQATDADAVTAAAPGPSPIAEGAALPARAEIEARLDTDMEGSGRVATLRLLLAAAIEAHDDALTDRVARELLAAAPEDDAAFAERRRILVARAHEPGLATLLRERAAAIVDRDERAALLVDAGRAAERAGDATAAAADYEAVLSGQPDHLAALEALADLRYRGGDVGRARALYAQLDGRPIALPLAELGRRRGELAEAEGQLDEATQHYRRAAAADPSRSMVHDALARAARAAPTPAATYEELREAAALLPRDAVGRLTELHMQLGELAIELGDPAEARRYFTLVLAHAPESVPALAHLADLYAAAQEWEGCAEVHGRLAYLADAPSERAELTFRQAEIYRLQLRDRERANAAYLKAADLAPHHLPTLRRLVGYYLGEGDLDSLREVVAEIEALGASLGDSAVEAGLGLAYSDDPVAAQAHLEGARPHELAAAIASLTALKAESLDVALEAATRAFSHERGDGTDEDPLQRAFERLLIDEPGDEGARLALARQAELDGDFGRARAHYAVLSWIDPFSPGARRLAQLGSPTVELGFEPVHPDALGPLRESLRVLGPRVLGLVAPRPGGVPEPAWNVRLQPIASQLGFPSLLTASVDALDEPAWVEPSSPPRLLVRRGLLNDPAAVAFAAARALHLLRAGVSLIEGRSDEDVAALLAAAAALFNPEVRPTSPFARAWLAELRALPLRPESVDAVTRRSVRDAFVHAFQPESVARRAAFIEAERLTANRVGYLVQGDLTAALRALAPVDAGSSRRARSALLSTMPALADLSGFATSPDGRRRVR